MDCDHASYLLIHFEQSVDELYSTFNCGYLPCFLRSERRNLRFLQSSFEALPDCDGRSIFRKGNICCLCIVERFFDSQQEGMLCAQHALNNLLQGAYFSAVDLAEIARKLDELERSVLGTVDCDLSLNVNDDGYFSVQVISEALKVFDLRLVGLCDFQLSMYSLLRTCSAFICNFENHWFTLRRINGCWFNLNSLNSGPTIISDCHLELYLAQLAAEGYTVFVVEGQLPPCPAENSVVDCSDIEDVVNVDSDAFQPKPFNNKILPALSPTDYVDESDEDLLKALIASREAADRNDRSLQKALMESKGLNYVNRKLLSLLFHFSFCWCLKNVGFLRMLFRKLLHADACINILSRMLHFPVFEFLNLIPL